MAECIQRIAQLHRLGPEDPNNLATAGRGLALFGPAGCGKSKIIDLYHAQYAPDPAKVLKVRVPQVARAEDLVIKILEELEDRYPADGTHRRRITRSLDAMVERDIGLVLFDEIHHFLAKSSRADVNTRGGHFLKQYLDSVKSPHLSQELWSIKSVSIARRIEATVRVHLLRPIQLDQAGVASAILRTA